MDALSLAVEAAVALRDWNARFPEHFGETLTRWTGDGTLVVSAMPTGDAGFYVTSDGGGLAPSILHADPEHLTPAVLRATPGPSQADVDSLRGLLDLTADWSGGNDQRARFILTSNWMRDRTSTPPASISPRDGGPPSPSAGRSGSAGHECRDGHCCGCGDQGEDIAAVHVWDEQHGFDSLACMVNWVKGRYMLSPSQLSGVRT